MFEWRCSENKRNMPSPEKDRLATEVMQCWADFQHGLSSDKRKYPIRQFRAFWEVTKRYAELIKSDPLIHKGVARAVNRLVDFLKVERKRVPGHVLRDAERLECLLLGGYDHHCEGEEQLGPLSSNTSDPPMANCEGAGLLQGNENPMGLQVQCYAGRNADERPVRFQLKDRDFIVEEVLDQWNGPDDLFFKVRADDGNLYIRRHSLPSDKWGLESFRQTAK
jgi:hypothetical protein